MSVDRDNVVFRCKQCENICKQKSEFNSSVCIKIIELPGLAPDTEIVENADGGRQAKSFYRFDLIDSKAIFTLARVLHEGEQKYTKDNWRKIPASEHINHALIHLYAYLAQDKQDAHLDHAFTRIMMAVALATDTKKE